MWTLFGTRGCLTGDIADNAVSRVLLFNWHASLKHAMSSRLCLYSCMLQTQAVECLKEDRHDMLRRSCLALLSVMAFAPLANSASISMASDVGAGNVERSDHTLHLQPPENTAPDIEASLAATAKAEHEKRQPPRSEGESCLSAPQKRWPQDTHGPFGQISGTLMPTKSVWKMRLGRPPTVRRKVSLWDSCLAYFPLLIEAILG